MTHNSIQECEQYSLSTKLDYSVLAGSATIIVRAPIQGMVGEVIVVDKVGAHPEAVYVTAVQDNTITFTPALAYPHNAGVLVFRDQEGVSLFVPCTHMDSDAWYRLVNARAAYDPYNAWDYDASLINLISPGTNDAVGYGVPGWTRGTGWTLRAGDSTYFTTGIIPATFSQDWSMFVLYNATNTRTGPLLSAGDLFAGHYFDLWSGNSQASCWGPPTPDDARVYAMGDKQKYVATVVKSGWMGISGRKCWFNGAVEATLDTVTDTTATGQDIRIGQHLSHGLYYDGIIARVLIVDSIVPDDDVVKVYGSMTSGGQNSGEFELPREKWVQVFGSHYVTKTRTADIYAVYHTKDNADLSTDRVYWMDDSYSIGSGVRTALGSGAAVMMNNQAKDTVYREKVAASVALTRGQLIKLGGYRLGTSTADTFEHSIYFMGWEIVYLT